MGGLDSAKVYDVPWTKMKDGDVTPTEGLTLYWFPASDIDYKHSSLRVSRVLALYGARCVKLSVADANSATAQKLLGDTKAPAVVLSAAGDQILNKLAATNGDLKVMDVEAMLESEVKKRRDILKDRLDGAQSKAEAGDKKGAIEDYQSIVAQKCLVPLLAKRAAKELKRLGVDVSDVPDGPKFDKSLGEKIQDTLIAGVKAENDSNYSEAKRLYEDAHKMDLADPAPLRYLAELYRHDIGDWDKASEIYNSILTMQSDPLSRAVALHGLGKITIHNGSFKAGEQMMEKSVETYPTPLAYRNLAVYWNSEGDSEKCLANIDQALKLAPDDPFNRVFAAVFMAGHGRTEEALKIAQDHEGLLPASYNLAAIYAQAGQKDKALAMLKRHFFEYERNQQVRAEEMMEARVDRVFDSLMKDKDFLALTSGADGKLPMRAGTTAH